MERGEDTGLLRKVTKMLEKEQREALRAWSHRLSGGPTRKVFLPVGVGVVRKQPKDEIGSPEHSFSRRSRPSLT
jgi:hypothetical protein